MGTTPGGLPYPAGSDPARDGNDAIQALAEALDPKLAVATASVPPFGAYSGTSTAWRQGRVVTIDFNVVATANNGGGAGFAVAPVGYRLPKNSMYFWVADSGTGTPCLIFGDTSGGFYHTFPRNSGQGTIGTITYIAAA